jgi:phospholipid N-methyltransferase
VKTPVAEATEVRPFPPRNSRVAFFLAFLRRPDLVGSIVPSSRVLARRLAEPRLFAGARSVVELGPGTGVTTRAMLDVMPHDARLLAIDVNEEFVAMLRADDDPRLIAHSGSAAHIREAVALHGLAQPQVVVSGIPFSTMSRALGRRIIAQIWASLAPGGWFVAYQVRNHVARIAGELLGPPSASLELRNLPPVRIYRWRKPA